jgi:hypothetical protein
MIRKMLRHFARPDFVGAGLNVLGELSFDEKGARNGGATSGSLGASADKAEHTN